MESRENAIGKEIGFTAVAQRTQRKKSAKIRPIRVIRVPINAIRDAKSAKLCVSAVKMRS